MAKVIMDELVDDLRVLVHEAESMLKTAAGQTSENGVALRTHAGDSLRNAKLRIPTSKRSRT